MDTTGDCPLHRLIIGGSFEKLALRIRVICGNDDHPITKCNKLDDGWPESEKAVFQAALSMVVVKNSR